MRVARRYCNDDASAGATRAAAASASAFRISRSGVTTTLVMMVRAEMPFGSRSEGGSAVMTSPPARAICSSCSRSVAASNRILKVVSGGVSVLTVRTTSGGTNWAPRYHWVWVRPPDACQTGSRARPGRPAGPRLDLDDGHFQQQAVQLQLRDPLPERPEDTLVQVLPDASLLLGGQVACSWHRGGCSSSSRRTGISLADFCLLVC